MQKKTKGRSNSRTAILNEHSCYETNGYITVVNGRGQEEQWSKPKLPRLKKCTIALKVKDTPSAAHIELEALLDTGTDITIVKPGIIEDLDNVSPIDIPVDRRISFGDDLQPAHDLAFFFPNSTWPHSSEYGIVSHAGWEFDVADVWIGQDLLNKLSVTFDGLRGTVTIHASEDETKRVVKKHASSSHKQKAGATHTQGGKKK